MARTRNFLIDNTIGKVFTNVTKVSDATSVNLIAGTQPKIGKLSTPAKTLIRVAKNLGGKPTGFSFPNTTVITKVTLSVAKRAKGDILVVQLKSGTTYETSVVRETFTLGNIASSVVYTPNTSVSANDNIYFDITYAGSRGSAGVGLTITFTYY